MQDNFITKISPSVRIIVLIFLALSLLMAKSIYLILFITVLMLILLIITDKKVNLYVKELKKILIPLLIFFIAYIIIFRKCDIVFIIVLLYKLVVIAFFIEIFFLNSNFKSIHEGLYGILKLLKKMNLNAEQLSLDITFALYFMKFLIESKEDIKNAQLLKNRKRINIKNFFLPCLVYSINKMERLQDHLKIKFYKLNYTKINIKSKIILVFSFFLFVICILKEVML